MGQIAGHGVAQRAVTERERAAGQRSVGVEMGSGPFSRFRPFPFTLSMLDVVSKESARMVDESSPPASTGVKKPLQLLSLRPPVSKSTAIGTLTILSRYPAELG